ncbi:TPA: AraC family transcriptional regulator [Pseudomonas putida]|nr:AraC family transcriptional regulator [Pseudomonas putida]HDS1799904.1 AraC family transcriptional regulator [Pseudomonas putida]HDS1806298.1 AraC family transcriptional regulator [Pseudomonas putida]
MYTISSGFISQLVNLLEGEGLDSSALCRQAGIDTAVLGHMDCFVRRNKVYRLMALAEERSGNPALGLRVCRHLLPGAFQLVGYVMMSSANLRQAIESMVQFSPLLGSGLTLGLAEEGGGLRLWLADKPGAVVAKPRSLEDSGLASVLGFCRWLTGNRMPQWREVVFCYPQPADISEHRRVFECDLRFGALNSSILFDRKALQLPLCSSNEALAMLHGDLARHRMEQLRITVYSARVRSLLLERLNLGDCDMEMVAACLHVSKRTLQRGLLAEGVQFKDLVDEVRQQLADYYLRYNTYTLQRVGELLGFKEASSFHKACSRWYGMSPGRYRTQLAEELAAC